MAQGAEGKKPTGRALAKNGQCSGHCACSLDSLLRSVTIESGSQFYVYTQKIPNLKLAPSSVRKIAAIGRFNFCPK